MVRLYIASAHRSAPTAQFSEPARVDGSGLERKARRLLLSKLLPLGTVDRFYYGLPKSNDSEIASHSDGLGYRFSLGRAARLCALVGLASTQRCYFWSE